MGDPDISKSAELVRPAPARGGYFSRSLSAKLLVLTVLAVLVAEALIFLPLLANFREGWLREKLETAAIAGLATVETVLPDTGSTGAMPQSQQKALLDALGVQLVAIGDAERNRLIARYVSIAPIDRTIMLDETTALASMKDSFGALLFGGSRALRILGSTGDGAFRTEIVLLDSQLRESLLSYARRFFLLSLVIAVVTGLLLWAAINRLMVTPIRRMTEAMIRFGDQPTDPARILVPEERADELGIAERELSAMQAKLSEVMKEQQRLANLGLAVSKINHDMRNILASSQMISDRLATLPDPKVQRMAPMLIKSLDRALHYTQAVLAYGRAAERVPERRRVDLRAIVVDVCDLLALGVQDTGIEFVNAVPEHFEVTVDPEQIHRLLTNLCRNAVQAMMSDDMGGVGVVRRLTVGARHLDALRTQIYVEDTGPGLPKKARDNLFQAFRGSARSGGTGLGLAIAMEIAQAHGGDLRLAATGSTGARFEVEVPRNVRPGDEATP
ncbi:HAMP domain-containing sensor histidine kinase [Fulvimarina sp. 2208YS6-2-32]|uniref:histidine kinase n=1 Tax=Fulvimarina uroteuthidis TaxID=3098149 RepID=A0ABU5I1J0_9HYPH|nr:HAMP domain-containing sensor histidine kinase [Fulvimarina sp. 2208YS6-2-32]